MFNSGNTAEKYIDRSVIDEHQKLFDKMVEDRNAAKEQVINRHTLDIAILGEEWLQILEMSRVPLFPRTNKKTLDLAMKTMVKSVGSTNGQTNLKGDVHKNVSVFMPTRPDEYKPWFIPGSEKQTSTYGIYSRSNMRPGEASNVTKNVLRMLTHKNPSAESNMGGFRERTQNIIMSKIDTAPCYYFMFYKMVEYLKLCISAYTHTESEARACMVTQTVFEVTMDNFEPLLQKRCVLNIDKFNRDELELIMMAIEEWPVINLTKDGDECVYSMVSMEACDVTLVTYVDVSQDITFRPKIRQSEIVWKLMVTIASKLGSVDELVNAIRDSMGADHKMLRISENQEDVVFTSSYGPTTGVNTLFIDVSGRSRVRVSDSTNLIASFGLILIDLIESERALNRLYYLSAHLGLCSGEIYTRGNLRTHELFKSIAREMGLTSLGGRGLLTELVFPGFTHLCKQEKLMDYFCDYVDTLRSGKAKPMVQLSLVADEGIPNTIASLVGKQQVIDDSKMNMKQRSALPSHKLKAWLYMHGIIDEKVDWDRTLLGTRKNAVFNPQQRKKLELANGAYALTKVELYIGDYDGERPGYETAVLQNIYHLHVYVGGGDSIVSSDGVEPVDGGSAEFIVDKSKRDERNEEMHARSTIIDKRRDGDSDDRFAEAQRQAKERQAAAASAIEKHEKVEKEKIDRFDRSEFPTWFGGPKGSNKVNHIQELIVKNNIIRIPGDGKCGLAALAESMKLGDISGSSLNEMFDINNEGKYADWLDVETLGAITHEMGYGLDVVNTSSRIVHRYDPDNRDRVAVVYNGVNHYDAWRQPELVDKLKGFERIPVPVEERAIENYKARVKHEKQ